MVDNCNQTEAREEGDETREQKRGEVDTLTTGFEMHWDLLVA